MGQAVMKQCGFVIRVSTDRQAANEEGSLKNQLQRLRAHVKYKRTACNEDWVEADTYVLKAVSGKDSLRSEEMGRLFEGIRTGRINTVACTALDRICRSVKDFLSFFEILNEHGVEFVCLKQNYDTTTPQGKLFTTVMMALAQFEREQTSERNKEASLARAERGLWNGGQITGYDLDPDRKGHLIPNADERTTVNSAFDTYLRCGSIPETARTMNRYGFRTKEYMSRRDKFHPAAEWTYSSVKQILHNYAYIGKKEINKKKKGRIQQDLPESQRYRFVDAVWELIVDEEKFYEVQALMRKNGRSKHNQAKRSKHTYILSSGLLWCGRCGSEMRAGAGTGARGGKYYYYVCKNKDCRFKVPATEIESVLLSRINELSTDDEMMADIVRATNRKLQTELPQLKDQKGLLQRQLSEVNDLASGIISEWSSVATDDSTVFLRDRLDQLGKRRKDLEDGIESLGIEIRETEREVVDAELVRLALSNFTEVFDHIPPHKQKELLRLVLHKAILTEDTVKIALYGRPPEIGMVMKASGARCQMGDWLPGLVSQSAILWDIAGIAAKRIARGQVRKSPVCSALLG
jgi:site-specific DNA recombinase